MTLCWQKMRWTTADVPMCWIRFYTRQTNGVRFLDWFTAAITGKPVEDVACVDCETPEYHWTRPEFPQ